MSSEAQIQANRLNALRSTGPKDASKTRFNSLKHGLLAKNLLIDKEDGQENAKEFYACLAALRNDLQPEGTIQEILVERIAQSYWRLKRSAMTEKGILRHQLDNCGHKTYEDYTQTTYGYLAEHTEIVDGKLRVTRPISDDEVEEKLLDIEDELEASRNGQADFSDLKRKYGDKPEDQLLEEHAKTLKDRQLTLKCIEVERDQKFSSMHDCSFLSSQIPSQDNAEHLLRYETTIERQLYRALNQLMRLKQIKEIGFVSQKQ